MKIILNNNSLFKSLRPFNDIGFVPTMGSIHEGHLSLIDRSNRTCKKTIVSIFVNPKQFNNKKDFKNYFTTATLQYKVQQPLMLTENLTSYDIKVNVYGVE